MTNKTWSIGKDGILRHEPDGKPILMQAFMFNDLTAPNGFLLPHPACQALWYYTILIKMQKLEEVDPIQYDDVWPPRVRHAKELFMSIAMLYSTTPDMMLKFWPNVDMQCVSMKSPKVHVELRHDKVPEIRTQ